MHYYQHHIGDFIKDTARLSDAQSMAYLRLMWVYYDTESPLKNDVDALAFDIGASASDVHQILKHFFFLHDDGLWHHSRCNKEILAFRQKSDKAKKSAEARWNNANAMRTHTERNADEPVSDANQYPVPTNQEPTKTLTENPPESGKPDPCPHQAIVDLYNKKLPELPGVRDITERRKTALRARWRSHERFQDLSWWANYFELVSESDFLMGRLPGKTWRADFDFLIKPDKFQKIIELGYQNG